ncbi:MAG: DUF1565 domain-containing protein [Spirochaetaceae bacterium]|nr:MAG: DUF1565 domain-containing protein [Spirochaetaceae bacterium]
MEFHVSQSTGDDDRAGTHEKPFASITRAAEVAVPGDSVVVHEGVYRERVNPPRGGESHERRITYRAARGETVAICGSEAVSGWTLWKGNVWKVDIPNEQFGSFNPFATELAGDWFDPRDHSHHRGMVFLDGHWMVEADSLDEVYESCSDQSQTVRFWFADVTEDATTLYADFGGGDPNASLVEVTTRESVFYPDTSWCDYITVDGFRLRHAATPWAPPTAEQIALIGTHWSRGWIIENNEISYSRCAGLSLGKYGDAWDNTSADTAAGYVATIERGLENGWDYDRVGSHTVRNNVIHHCEQAGIVGSLGAIGSLIERNEVHSIHVIRRFGGAEQAGIKLHAPLKTTIRDNRVHHANRGLWLDWMTQSTRVTGNLFYDNDLNQDFFAEVNHGPYLVDNNIFLSRISIRDQSESGVYAYNYIAGEIQCAAEHRRDTPWQEADSTALAGLAPTRGGDNHFYGNTFAGPGDVAETEPREVGLHSPAWKSGYGLAMYNTSALPCRAAGNRYVAGARPFGDELHDADSDAFLERGDGVDLRHLGQTAVSCLPFRRAAPTDEVVYRRL